MDSLAYTYSGNQLLTVAHAGQDDEGFKDGNVSGGDYFYDDNGNMAKQRHLLTSSEPRWDCLTD